MSLLKKIAAACAALVGITAAAPAIWDGSADVSWFFSDTTAKQYNLRTAEQLAGLANLVNDGISTFVGRTITLDDDIFLNDTAKVLSGECEKSHCREWIPIGTSKYNFKGIFDGSAGDRNHRIYGLYINDSARDYAGFFGYASSGEIRNLDLLAGSIEAGRLVGALAGEVWSVTVSNIHSEVNVVGRSGVGGLAGESRGKIYSSSVSANVKGLDSVGGMFGVQSSLGAGYVLLDDYFVGNVTGRMYVGGLAGYGGNIKNCYVEGTVTADSNYVGGLVGWATSRVDSSFHEGVVKGYSYVGGVIGSSNASVNSVHHTGGNVNGFSYVGGAIGRARSLVKNSYSESDVFGDEKYVGGLVGYSANISNSYAKGNIVGNYGVGGVVGGAYGHVDSTYFIDGDVRGDVYVGGLIGYANDSVTNSYSKGTVVGTGNFVGGLMGFAYEIVTNSYSESAVTGSGKYVGGLVGEASKLVEKSYSKGRVVGNGKEYVGGLIGYSRGPVEDCYSESDVVGAGNQVGGAIGAAFKDVNNVYAKGTVVGRNYVGGVFGSLNSYVNVNNSFYEGDSVSGVDYVGGFGGYSGKYTGGSCNFLNLYAKTNVKGNLYVGGLMGHSGCFVEQSYFVGQVSGTSAYVGGLAGYEAEKIRTSYAEGAVKGDSSYVGGVVGYTKGDIDSSYHTKGDINGSAYVGGVCGYSFKKVVIDHSYSLGNVYGQDSVGGLVGYAGGKVLHSFASNGLVKGRNVVGGLAGFANDSVVASHFEGDSVVGIGEVGGLVGYARSYVDSSYSTANVKGDDNVGGLIGSADGPIVNSFAMGNVSGDVEHSSSGNDNIGGLVGYQYHGWISKSMALGDVSGTTNVGGLVGHIDGAMILQSYANGNVTGSYFENPANEEGNIYIGGLVGYGSGTLEETYASGVVKGRESKPVNTGCITGYASSSLKITKSYYDKTKCSLGVGNRYATGDLAKTTEEMQTQSTFEDWDFTDTWKIMENMYPFLQVYGNSMGNAVVETQSLEGFKYDGTPKTPNVISVKLYGKTLTYDTDYTVTYKDNINAGTASINICGNAFFGGCKEVKFEIDGMDIDVSVGPIANMKYTGDSLTPQVLAFNGSDPIDAKDYVVEYKDNVNAGTATVLVKMVGNYKGSTTMNFTIEKASSSIVQNPKASDIVLGERLASSQLTGGIAKVDGKNIEGEFVWKSPETKPELENDGFAVVFVPTDTANYAIPAEVVVPVKVLDLVYVTVHVGEAVLDSVTFSKGSNYTLPQVSDSVGYEFIGFYNGGTLVGQSGDKISVSENTRLSALYKVKKFVVTFMKGTTELQSSEYAYGSVPTAPTVALPRTEQYTYSFEGWDKEIVAVTGPATYHAVIDSVVNKYKVVFKNYDGKDLKDSTYDYGTAAEKIVKPANPSRTATAEYSYAFNDWNPKIEKVTGDAVYTAVFDSTLQSYAVTFVNGSEELQSNKVPYGTLPKFNGNEPTKKATAKYTYTFKGWTPEIAKVTQAATYKAVFDSVVRKYTITFKNGEIQLQKSDIAYGETPKYTGKTPTKPSSKKYSYKFAGWTPKLESVTKAATYQAVFDSTKLTGIMENRFADRGLSVRAVARSVQISAAPIGSTYAVMDLRGRVLQKGRVESANFNIAMALPGIYMVQVGRSTQKVNVK